MSIQTVFHIKFQHDCSTAIFPHRRALGRFTGERNSNASKGPHKPKNLKGWIVSRCGRNLSNNSKVKIK